MKADIHSRFCQGFFGNEMAGFQQYTLIPADIVGKVCLFGAPQPGITP